MNEHPAQWHPLGVTLSATVTVFLVLRLFLNPVTEGRGDLLVLAVALPACAAVIAVMVVHTAWRRWTWLGSGLLVLFTGLWVLLAYILAARISGTRDPSEVWLELARSCLSVGSVATLYGLWRRRGHTRRGGPV